MANLTDRRPIKNIGTSVITCGGYTFLPGQVITIPDKVWYGKEMWKIPNLKAEVKGGNALSPDEDDMIEYAITQYIGSTKQKTTVVKSGIEYQGLITYVGDTPLIYFKEIGVTPQVPITSISLALESQSIAPGGTTTGTVTIEPANATNREITFSSSDETVATVTENADGTVTVNVLETATASSTCRITATSVDGNKTSYKTVTVSGGG